MDGRPGRSAPRHIPTNDPLHLLLAPSEDFRDHSDRKARGVKFRGCGSPEVVEMEIAIVDLGRDLGSIERRAEAIGRPWPTPHVSQDGCRSLGDPMEHRSKIVVQWDNRFATTAAFARSQYDRVLADVRPGQTQ